MAVQVRLAHPPRGMSTLRSATESGSSSSLDHRAASKHNRSTQWASSRHLQGRRDARARGWERRTGVVVVVGEPVHAAVRHKEMWCACHEHRMSNQGRSGRGRGAVWQVAGGAARASYEQLDRLKTKLRATSETLLPAWFTGVYPGVIARKTALRTSLGIRPGFYLNPMCFFIWIDVPALERRAGATLRVSVRKKISEYTSFQRWNVDPNRISVLSSLRLLFLRCSEKNGTRRSFQIRRSISCLHRRRSCMHMHTAD